MELYRTSVYGSNECRYGVLNNLDVHILRGGCMREITIILIILITALIIWMPRKGDKR
jgi:hypothetical protein